MADFWIVFTGDVERAWIADDFVMQQGGEDGATCAASAALFLAGRRRSFVASGAAGKGEKKI
ncbi:hypothetical protein C404_09260 [Ralstonia sp. AU12-08]|nr:hypothetical protein C404_09260 [Ralstonia sp. AU12-08]